ncbi:MAG: caspase family protein [Planctomycetes bacterium]|nr:caspase family protein [Planctomycetota bacterium]
MTAHELPSRFQVLETLVAPDAAGMWRARDTLLGREVLLKRPLAHEGRDADVERERSMREARALASVKHASVARLFEVIETPQGPLFALEPLEGETLSDALARVRSLAPDAVRALGIELASALEAVHARGIVHRGVSAGNIVLRPAPMEGSTLLLAGFTFAKSGPGVGGAIPGTTFVYRRGEESAREPVVEPPHPAPEQLRGEAADARADVFGLGWVLYECLTGMPPYAVELDLKHWRAPRNPSDSKRAVPRALSECVLRCLALAPNERYASAAAVRAALEATVASAKGKQRLVLAGGGLVVLIAAAFGLRAALAGGGESGSRGPEAIERGSRVAGTASTVYQAKYTTSRALLIGIGEVYAKTGSLPLPNAERDVGAIRAELEAIQAARKEPWEIDSLLGPQATQDAIVTKLRALAALGGPDDKLFVYYAGHGELAGGTGQTGFVVPALAPLANEDPQHVRWVPFSEFTDVFKNTRAKHVLVVMDCCYGGKVGEADAIAMRSSAPVFEEKFLRERAHVIITSGREDERVSDGPAGGHSPFAQAFLDQITRGGVAFTSTELYAEVNKRLYEERQSARIKRPTKDAEGEVVFFLR